MNQESLLLKEQGVVNILELADRDGLLCDRDRPPVTSNLDLWFLSSGNVRTVHPTGRLVLRAPRALYEFGVSAHDAARC